MPPPAPAASPLPEVELTAPPVPELPRTEFQQVSTLPQEPKTDVKIKVKRNGRFFRERMLRTEIPTAGGPGLPQPGFNFSISNALLDDAGEVAKDRDGKLLIVPPEVRHEFRIDGEDLGRMTRQQVENALLHAREVAAAKADDYFSGMELGEKVFADRLV